MALSLRTQLVQTTIVQWLASKATDKLGFKVTIDGFYLDWVDFARVTHVKVLDKQGKPLFDIGQIRVNLKLATILERDINLEAVELERGLVQLRIDRKSGKLNINEFIDAIQGWVNDTTVSPNPSIFSIDKARLSRMSFAYIDERQPALPNQFDYYHFKLVGIDGEVLNFRQRRDTISLQTVGLKARDAATGLRVHQINTHFTYHGSQMRFEKLQARIGDSYIADSLTFNYPSVDAFSNFNHEVEMKARLDSTVVTSQDISFFAPTLKDWFETYTVSGNFSGTVDNFRLNRFRLYTGKNSFLVGSVGFKGLPEVDETFVDLRLKPSFINPQDLEPYTGKTAVSYLNMLGVFDVSGSFTGFFKNFVAKTSFRTDLGVLHTDIQMEIKEDVQASTYNGRLQTSAFDFGRLLNQRKYLQKIDIDGSIKGSGFALNKVNVFLDAQIARMGVLGYDYANITTKMHLQKQHFSGNLSIKDPHLIFNGKGSIDLVPGKEVVDLQATLGRVNFEPIKLTPYPLDVSTEVSLKFTGFDFDNFLGMADFRNLRVLYKDERLDLNDISVQSYLNQAGNKIFNFNSALVDARIEGSFKYKKFIADALAMLNEYEGIIKNRPANNTEVFYRKGTRKDNEYKVSFDAKVKNINPLLDLIDQPIYLSKNTEIDAELQFGLNEMILVNTHVDTMAYKDKIFSNLELDITAIKTKGRPDVTGEVFLSSKTQHWFEGIDTEKLLVEGLWDKGKIKFKLNTRQTGTTNMADVHGVVQFGATSTRIQLENSHLSLVERIWTIAPNNLIEISDSSTVLLENVAMSNENQQLSLHGNLTGQPSDTLFIKAGNFQLSTLKPITKEELGGIVNAQIAVSNLHESPLFEGLVEADSLRYQNFQIGRFTGKADWISAQRALGIHGDLWRGGQPALTLNGLYVPDSPEPLDLVAHANRFNIDIIQLLIGNSVSNLKGYATGDLTVKGSITKPLVAGKLDVEDGQVKINYLNTTYFFEHEVTFSPNEISANGLDLVDENGQTAFVSKASLRHQNYQQFYVRLEGSLSHFMVFNLPAKPSNVYYGTGICTGNLLIAGYFDDVLIKADARTDRGTRIFIPLDAANNEDLGESFITFVDKSGQKKNLVSDSVSKIKLSGVRMDFDLEVTDEAYGEIIFDKKAGDIIRATGTGKIKMAVDTRGEFSVIGQYVMSQGDYHFTTYNLINKDFDIRPGSTITWNGPVLEGVMDILAEYNLNASLAPLASSDPQIQEKPESKRRYPVVVRMRLTEELLKPNITLGLEIRDYPKNSDLNYYVQAFQTRIANDEQELNRQVFSLMIFRMFAPQGEFAQASNISYSSFSDLVSNQLSSWLSQFDENLEVNVDLSGLSQAALNNFQLRFSYTMLEGRLRLTRDGGFTNAQNQTSAMSIAGDWTLEYMLSKDGVFRVKMFHRTNQNLVVTGLNNTSTQGASVLHTQSFNKLSDLFPKRKKKTATSPPKKQEAEPPKSAAVLRNEGKE